MPRIIRKALSLITLDDAGNEVSRQNFTSVNAVKREVRKLGLEVENAHRSAARPSRGGRSTKSPYYHS